MTSNQRIALQAQYKDGYAEVSKALEGISPEEMDFKIAPERWSCREIVHHLADSEARSGMRFRQLLTEFNPYLQAYDEAAYARRFVYARRPIEPALALFKATRENTAQLFDYMTDDDWRRTGEHSESGPYSAEKWLETYAAHAHGHAEQIRQNRKAFRSR